MQNGRVFKDIISAIPFGDLPDSALDHPKSALSCVDELLSECDLMLEELLVEALEQKNGEGGDWKKFRIDSHKKRIVIKKRILTLKRFRRKIKASMEDK